MNGVDGQPGMAKARSDAGSAVLQQRLSVPAPFLQVLPPSLHTDQKLVEYTYFMGHDTGVQRWGQRKAAFGGALSADSSSSSSGSSGRAMSTAAT